MPRLTRSALIVTAWASWSSSAHAQTFVQLTDLGSSIGPRLTRLIARARVGEPLFGAIAQKITLVDRTGVPTAYEFASDPLWHRVLFGKKDEYVRAFDNSPPPARMLESPRGIDISTQKILFIADPMNGRVLLARFDPVAQTVSAYGEASFDGIGGLPLDVAWDGGTSPTPAGTEIFYAIDGAGRLSYWNYAPGVASLYWVYGTEGSGTGQFRDPSGVCVGHTLGANGGAVFTSDVYVADAGNGRLVWLRRSSSGAPVWMASVSLSTSGVPTDCSVDQFGNVYVVGRQPSRHHRHRPR